MGGRRTSQSLHYLTRANKGAQLQRRILVGIQENTENRKYSGK